jgi:hypothetical protein
MVEWLLFLVVVDPDTGKESVTENGLSSFLTFGRFEAGRRKRARFRCGKKWERKVQKRKVFVLRETNIVLGLK